MVIKRKGQPVRVDADNIKKLDELAKKTRLSRIRVLNLIIANTNVDSTMINFLKEGGKK